VFGLAEFGLIDRKRLAVRSLEAYLRGGAMRIRLPYSKYLKANSILVNKLVKVDPIIAH
jgi:hypothetical protein